MIDALTRRLARFLKIPPEPLTPFGEEQNLRVFRASRQFLKYQYVLWGIRQVPVCIFFLVGAVALIGGAVAAKGGIGSVLFAILVPLELGLLAAQVLISYLSVRLHYEMRWYKVTDRSLRIREGVFFIREMTMTFVNIQNIEITQGPIQRWLGIADLKVQTAGGGGSAVVAAEGGKGQHVFNMHVGYFRGVDNAQEIMMLMQERLKRSRSSGLGDHDDHHDVIHAVHAPVAAISSTTLAAARDLLAETRALREAIQVRG